MNRSSHFSKSCSVFIVSTAILMWLAGAPLVAQTVPPVPPPVLQIDRIECGATGSNLCELKVPLAVQLKGPVGQWTGTGRPVGDLVLVVNGLPFEHTAAATTGPDDTRLLFRLDPEPDRVQWKKLFAGQPRRATFLVALAAKEASVTAGAPAAYRIVSTAVPRQFLIRADYTTYVYIFLAALVAAFWYLGLRSDLLRDPEPSAPGGAPKPYSLARTQLALWTVAIIGSYLFIWAILGDTNPLNNTALILTGVSALTGLLANVVDQNAAKPAPVATTVIAPAAPTGAATPSAAHQAATIIVATSSPPRVSRGFLRDILSEDDGLSISRMQMVVWMLVLAFVFVYSVWSDLAMPTFDPVLLGLLGISNGTYVGFKVRPH